MKKAEYNKFIEGDLYYVRMRGSIPIIEKDTFIKRFLAKTTLHGLYHCIEFEYKDLFSTLEQAEGVRLQILLAQLEEKGKEFKKFENYVKDEITNTLHAQADRQSERSEKNNPKFAIKETP